MSTIWESINKIQNMHLHISSAIMVRLLKMMADVCLLSRVLRLNSIEVSLDSVHTPQFRLPYVLFLQVLQVIQ